MVPEPQEQRRHKRQVMLTMIPTLAMVHLSAFMAFAMLLAIPGNATPKQVKGLWLIWETFIFYPLIAVPFLVAYIRRALPEQKPNADNAKANAKNAKTSRLVLNLLLIGAWVRILIGWTMLFSS